MSTGNYDNFWMHKNNRLKPVLILPKNDNYKCCALLTDNYKQVQTGGCPTHLNNFIPSQNIAASCHEKDQRRKGFDQSLWPCSVYSLPLMSSCTDNLHSQEPFFTRANNFINLSSSSLVQEEHDFRHLEIPNYNINSLPPYNTSSLANGSLARTQLKQNTGSQISRIRVKDVFSLNNNVQSQPGLDCGLFQQRCGVNFPFTHHNRMIESQNQTEYTKFKTAASAESSTPSQYDHKTSKQTFLNSQEQFNQGSGSFYQPNDGFSSEDVEFIGIKQSERGLPMNGFKTSVLASLLVQSPRGKSTVEREMQNCYGNAGPGLYVPGGEKPNTTKNLTELNNPNCSGSWGLNERPANDPSNPRNVPTVNCDLQENLPKTDEFNVVRRNSSCENGLAVSSKSTPLKEMDNEQNCFIKISIPHTGESSFIRLNNRDSTDGNSTANMQSLYETNDKPGADRNTQNFINKENGVNTEWRANSSPPSVGFIGYHTSHDAAAIRGNSPNQDGSIALTSDHQVDATNKGLQKFDGLKDKVGDLQNSVGSSQQIHQKNALNISRSDQNTTEIPLNNFTSIKQESFHVVVESEVEQDGQSAPVDFHPTIETQEDLENSLWKKPSAVSEARAKIDVTKIENLSSDCKNAPVPVADSEIDQVNTLKNNPNERHNTRKENKEGRETEKEEAGISTVNYKSRINRDKLDLLIQFLKKDQDTVGGCEDKRSSRGTVRNNLCRSRRKLSKACIVRNKNNSREMISLMSLKSNATCKISQITKRSQNLKVTEEGKSIDDSKKQANCASPCRESETKKSDSSTAETSQEIVCLSKQQSQESSEEGKCAAREEKAIINTVKAFQNLKTHFCMSCNLVLSIDSFWINVVSGELRCLNCFKRVALKSEGNDASLLKPLQKGKTEKESKTKEDATDEDGTKPGETCKGDCRKTNDIRENIKRELLEAFGSVEYKYNERKELSCSCRRSRSGSEGGISSQKGKPTEEQKILKTEKSPGNSILAEELTERRLLENRSNPGMKELHGKNRRKGSSGEENLARKEENPSSVKATISKEQHAEDETKKQEVTKQETIVKLERPVGKSTSKTDGGFEGGAKKEVKGVTDRSADDARQESRCQKVEECNQKDVKGRNCTDASVRKILPKGGGPSPPGGKDHAAEELTNRRHESKSQHVSREDRDRKKPKLFKEFGWKDARRSGFNHDGLENRKRGETTEQPRKRKNSDEDFSARKVHIAQDLTERDVFQASTTPKKERTSLESDSSRKGNLQDKANGRISKGKPRTIGSSKEECLLEEDSRKAAKFPSDREKAKDIWKGHVKKAKPPEPTRGKATDSPRGQNKKEQRDLQKGDLRVPCPEATDTERGPRRDSSNGEYFRCPESKENSTAEDRNRKKSEKKEGSHGCSRKVPKTGPKVVKTPAKDDSWKHLKEKQNSKIGSRNPNGKFRSTPTP